MMLAPLLLLQVVASGQSSDIIVTGRSPAVTGQRLAKCLARHCPPREDIAASLDHAETQFVAGDYPGARRTLIGARARNRKYVAQLPVEVGDLLRANARLASLNGSVQSGFIGQIESTEALTAGLGANDARVIAQRMEIGESYLAQGEVDKADDVFQKVTKQAHKIGATKLEGSAMFRRAAMYGALGSLYPQYKSGARQMIREISATTKPEMQEYRDGARLLEAQLAGFKDNVAEVSRIAASIADHPTARPVLLYQRTLDLGTPMRRKNNVQDTSWDDAPQWADFTFNIGRDGMVSDVDVQRRSSGDLWWIDEVKDNIAARVYAPLVVPAGSDGAQRIERFSMVHDLVMKTGSRMVRRLQNGRLERIDLTVEPTMAASSGVPSPAVVPVRAN